MLWRLAKEAGANEEKHVAISERMECNASLNSGGQNVPYRKG